MTIVDFRIEVKGISRREYYILGINTYCETKGYSITIGLGLVEFQITIGERD